MKDHPAARALRQANKLFKQANTTKELSDYEKGQQSFQRKPRALESGALGSRGQTE
jgi:hypothetical protein